MGQMLLHQCIGLLSDINMTFIDKVFLYILNNRSKGKRTCFDILHLKEWLQWAINKNYLFTSTDDKNNITGVLVVCPIGKWLKTPNIQQIIDALSKNDKESTDYYIMDALSDNKESRKDLVNKALDRFKDIESDQNVNLFAQVNDKIIKFNKQTILTLKN
jgi:hypothetical protein